MSGTTHGDADREVEYLMLYWRPGLPEYITVTLDLAAMRQRQTIRRINRRLTAAGPHMGESTNE